MEAFNQEYLKSVLHYSPVTGLFTWIESGRKAGSINNIGYILIKIQGKSYKAHRLAFLYMTGSFPKHQCDHINRIRHDNKWENLRDVLTQENCLNRSNNKSGIVGVYWSALRKKWHSRIQANGKSKHLGYFDDIGLAGSAYIVQSEKLIELLKKA